MNSKGPNFTSFSKEEAKFLGGFIRERSYRLSSKSLAKACGISTNAIQNIKSGRTIAPPFGLMMKLSEILGFSLDELAESIKSVRSQSKIISPPGATIQEQLNDRGMSQTRR